MSKFSIPVNGNVITDSQLLLNKLKTVILENNLSKNVINALKELLQSEELDAIFGTKEKEKLQLIFAAVK